jgi:hypothetical protein
MRKKKKNKITHKLASEILQQVKTVALLDLLDSAPGIYTLGGSLAEVSLMLTCV